MFARRNSLLKLFLSEPSSVYANFANQHFFCSLCHAVPIAIDTFSIILLHPEIAAFCSREIRTGIRVPGWSK
jgi:hypothetical protein